ncbi:hypothetical protein LB561_22725 [Mesorhizobium sp. B292B1B]|uniref:hypothetical protein n=1 Tax=unclassified Mesorhizobium TaxID=325217 RepID=UPI0011267294|nr:MULTISPECIES: hypothetical protein [unclassified Mesorhizobium]MCA0016130.1 hypothetical protein [Mesorhizobium sp. B294B1A1]MCA0040096.1 hypothetical protein [Mesorhizobium sp. B292B1B]TPM43341.1 hypothetical protein FJ964_21755 [Mesorhizobium sp. B2-3-2]
MRRPRAASRQLDAAAPIVFIVFTGLGAAYIVAAKSLSVSAFVVTFVPIALMIGYAAMIMIARGLRLRDDQTGDNFYYMGFIFTLTSLAVSLYQYGGGGAVDEIVRNFGIAVSSTIAGIAFRIVFNQLRRDPMEVERVSRLELAEASRKVRRELDGILSEMNHFQRSNQQMLQEGYHDIRTQVETSAKSLVQSLDLLAKEASEHIRVSSLAIQNGIDTKELRGGIDQTAKAVHDINAILTSASTQIAAATQSVADKLGSMSTPDKVIEVRLEPVVAGLQRAIETAMSDFSSRLGDVAELRRGLEQSTAEALRASAVLDKLAATFEGYDRAPTRQGLFRRLWRGG